MKVPVRESRKKLVKQFQSFLSASGVISDPEAMKPFESDALTLFARMPLLVLLPENTAQVQQILKICHDHQLPVVARGAGTGLSAGATPHSAGILLCLSRLDRILEIDPDARLARVQPGVRNLAISEAAKVHGLFYAPDPSSQIACSIGGNVAENSGGVHCLKYGLTTHNILKLSVVTAQGEKLIVGGDGLDSPGPDLLALLTGSEGLLGIVTEITVRLLPLPEKAQVLLAAFYSVADAANAVAAVIGNGIIPAGLEMMDGLTVRAVNDFLGIGYPAEAEALLLCELDGSEQEVSELITKVEHCFKQHKAYSVQVSHSEEERAKFWQGRKSAFPAVGQLAPDYYCMDGTIPRGQLARVLTDIQQRAEQYQLTVTNVFHAGDGNLHPLILFDAGNLESRKNAEELGGKILEICISAGGCITGEHGVGLEKIRQMPMQFSEQELAQFHRIKAAFDPELRLNPGKGIPVLKRCQEYRVLDAQKEASVYG